MDDFAKEVITKMETYEKKETGRAAPDATTPAMSASGRQTPSSICWKTGSTLAVW